MGEPKPALVELRAVEDSEGGGLRREILDDSSTAIDLTGSHWIDRDDQTLDSVLLVATRGFGPGQSFAGEAEVFNTDDPQNPEVAGSRLAVGGNFRRDRALALHLRYGLLGVGQNLERRRGDRRR
jgi:hypothetical protein